jgi:hypothetical protein
MEITIEYKDKPFEEELLELLKGNIFHVTSYENFKLIKSTEMIANNLKKSFALNPGSDGCFSIIKGYVSFFDLRHTSTETINQTLSKYYFLSPPWFRVNEHYRDTFDIVFLIFDKKHANKLIINSAAVEYRENNKLSFIQYIPQTECWFPGDVPLKYITKSFHVIISRPDHTSSFCNSMSKGTSEEIDRLIIQAKCESLKQGRSG